VQGGRRELLEIKLQADQHRSQDVFQFLALLQVFRLFFPRQQLLQALVGCLPHSLGNASDHFQHDKHYL
jgi:hypothetical protein